MAKKNTAFKEASHVDYWSRLDDEEKEFLNEFNEEFHGGSATHKGTGLITGTEAIKEANRNHNSIYQDAFNVSLNTGKLTELTMEDRRKLEVAQDESEWQNIFKESGRREATEAIFDQLEQEINDGVDLKVAAARFHIKLQTLAKYARDEKRKVRNADTNE
jgi:hypothetical protein